MDTLMVLKNPIWKRRTKPPKPNKLSILPQKCSRISEIEPLEELNIEGQFAQPKISFVKLYFDACLNNEITKKSHWFEIGGDEKAQVMPAVTTQLVMEMDYGTAK